MKRKTVACAPIAVVATEPECPVCLTRDRKLIEICLLWDHWHQDQLMPDRIPTKARNGQTAARAAQAMERGNGSEGMPRDEGEL